MRVIGAGLPRTATLSQKVALEILGVTPCYHMVNVLSDLSEAPRWRRALDGEVSASDILGDHPATVDWPGSFFYLDLIERHPEAKVVLSVRNGDSWARSMHETIWGMFYDNTLPRHLSDARACVDPMWDGYISMMKEMWERSGLLNGEATTCRWMSDAMARYNAEVQRVVPAERLLVWEAGDGWEPLCDFLGLPVPAASFPRLNDAKQFDRRIIDAALAVIHEARSAPPALFAI